MKSVACLSARIPAPLMANKSNFKHSAGIEHKVLYFY